MKHIFQKTIKAGGLLLAGALVLASCNKELEPATPIVTPAPTGKTVSEIVNEDPTLTYLKAAVTRAGSAISGALSDRSAVYTVFAPDDDAFRASFAALNLPTGISTINLFRPGQLDTLLRYHLVGGQRLNASGISDKFPNMYLQSMFVLQAPSASLPPGYRMPLGISRRGSLAWANNIPVKQADIAAANGVIHKISFLLNPPDKVIAQLVAADTSLSYLLAAVQHADKKPPAGAPQLLPLLANAAANFTVFAPDNNAFRALLTALGVPPDPSSIALLPSETVWGIVAFHVLGVRAFAANLPAGNGNLASLIGVPIQSKVTVTAPLPPTSVEVRGPGNVLPTNPPFPYFAQVTAGDIHAINGVVHKVNAVLLPQ
jgi:uncharacterized surface protein with fasciclin (FAS1) repeats|nr:fasciclin domain-containing protein [Chitinophagaceae bacterium]